MRWFQWNGYHKATYKARYPHIYSQLEALNIGDIGSMTLIETVEALLEHIHALHRHIELLEIEKDLT